MPRTRSEPEPETDPDFNLEQCYKTDREMEAIHEARKAIQRDNIQSLVLQSQPDSPSEVNNYRMSDMDKFIALTKLKEETREHVDKLERQKKKAWAEYFKYKKELMIIEKKLQHKEESSDDELERNKKRLKQELLDN